MDFYEGVVVDYLRADRSIFLNTECCIQLKRAESPDNNGPHWYCDAVACDFRVECIFLCEISYEKSLANLVKRLHAWHNNWPELCKALARDCHIPSGWPVRPWLFVPQQLTDMLKKKIQQIPESGQNLRFKARITPLEDVQPWKYKSWNTVHVEGTPEGAVSSDVGI